MCDRKNADYIGSHCNHYYPFPQVYAEDLSLTSGGNRRRRRSLLVSVMGEPVILAFMPFGRLARRGGAEDSQNT